MFRGNITYAISHKTSEILLFCVFIVLFVRRRSDSFPAHVVKHARMEGWRVRNTALNYVLLCREIILGCFQKLHSVPGFEFLCTFLWVILPLNTSFKTPPKTLQKPPPNTPIHPPNPFQSTPNILNISSGFPSVFSFFFCPETAGLSNDKLTFSWRFLSPVTYAALVGHWVLRVYLHMFQSGCRQTFRKQLLDRVFLYVSCVGRERFDKGSFGFTLFLYRLYIGT